MARVLAISLAARAEGVRPGQRRRQAQECCPELELIAHDPDRDARAFEPVLVAVESLTPRIEVLRPGECAFLARGAARYHGGEAALTAAVLAAVDRVLGALGRCQVGIADGRFAASLAARHASLADPASRGQPTSVGPRDPRGGPVSPCAPDRPAAGRHWIVPPGEILGFLATFPVEALERPELTDLLTRLGLRTLGDLATLPRAAMAARFGPEGIRAHRLATGLDEHPRASRRSPPELGVAAALDPPVTRVDVAAFAAKALADELVDRLERLGLACTRLRIEVETEHGEMLARVWRHEPPARSSRRGASAGPLPRTEVLLVSSIPSARQVRASSRPASAQRPAQSIPAPPPVPPSRASLPRRPCPPRQTRRPRQQRPGCLTFLPRRSRSAQPNRPQPTRRPRSLCQDCPPRPPRRTRSPPPPRPCPPGQTRRPRSR